MTKNGAIYDLVRTLNPIAIAHMNTYLAKVMCTRGGRVGSGMGSVLETLWGYNLNRVLRDNEHGEFEIAWFPDHQYHDFACISAIDDWEPSTKSGEFFRIEAKSMIFGSADEPKAHFDVLQNELDEDDAILLIVWKWTKIDERHVCPLVIDCFFERALPVARLRDVLHLQRGGAFVDRDACHDGCDPLLCTHHGEPLNADGKRERKSGPNATRVSAKTSHAQNFGGMLRMLKCSDANAKKALREECQSNPVGRSFVAFIHRNFPREELNHYSVAEWRGVAKLLGLELDDREAIQNQLIELGRDKYRSLLPDI